MTILVNSVFSVGNSKYRCLWIGSLDIIAISLEDNRMPIRFSTIDFNARLKIGDISIIEVRQMHNLYESPKYEARRDEIWEKLKVYLLDEPNIFESKYRRNLIVQNKEEIGFSEQHILSLMKRYWQRGKNKNAFLPDYPNCGAQGRERSSGDLKRGRPNFLEVQGVNVTDEWKKVFTKGTNQYFYSKARNSIVTTFNLIKRDCLEENPDLVLPTLAQFRYWFSKNKEVKKEIKGRYSSKKYYKDYRALLGSKNEMILMPGTFEIDNHTADFHLVSSYNRDWIIGRATLTLLIDRYSHLITGIYVGIDSSYSNSMMALYNTVQNKVDFCGKYGIQIKEEDWPNSGLPQRIIADRGEIEGKSIENLVDSLGVEVELQPSYRPEAKGLIEGFFSLLNKNIKTLVPGAIDENTRERGDKDYRLNAELTIDEYTKIVIHTILYHNKNLILNYIRTPKMIEENIIPTPNNLWIFGITNYGTSMRYADNMVKLSLMPKSQAVITRQGIKFKKMFYASKGMVKKGIFEKGGVEETQINIFYDPRNLEKIYLINPNGEIEVCDMLAKSYLYKDKSYEECLQLIDKENEMKRQFQSENEHERVGLINNIQRIITESKHETSHNLSNRERLLNIGENRRAEKKSILSSDVLEIYEEKDEFNEL